MYSICNGIKFPFQLKLYIPTIIHLALPDCSVIGGQKDQSGMRVVQSVRLQTCQLASQNASHIATIYSLTRFPSLFLSLFLPPRCPLFPSVPFFLCPSLHPPLSLSRVISTPEVKLFRSADNRERCSCSPTSLTITGEHVQRRQARPQPHAVIRPF